MSKTFRGMKSGHPVGPGKPSITI